MAAHLAGDDFLRRFRTEAQFLASLEHPNIPTLLDGGVSPSGHPYLVVEYVEGETLDRYSDDRKLGIEARLRLFLQVCQAVDHAHRNLILHRDLKPANVLVTTDGVVKLLDFGTASLLEEGPSVTVTRARMLTPRYASPEQLRGERPGVTGDVFSLGVILYELLTGAWPFGDPDSVMSGLRRAAGHAAPTAPSSAVTAEAPALRSLGQRSCGACWRAICRLFCSRRWKTIPRGVMQRWGFWPPMSCDFWRAVRWRRIHRRFCIARENS